jgi:uncharacterized membrane protein YhaH (DUF805 family)
MTNNEVAAIIWIVFILLLLPAVIIPYWRIFAKLGFSGWLSLLMFIPIANIVVLYVIAFSERTVRAAPVRYGATQSSGGLFCTKCGSVLAPDIVFCGACGTRRG